MVSRRHKMQTHHPLIAVRHSPRPAVHVGNSFTLSLKKRLVRADSQPLAPPLAVSPVNPIAKQARFFNQNAFQTQQDHLKGTVFGSVFGAVGGLFIGTLSGVIFTKEAKYVPLLGLAMVGSTALCAFLGGGVGYSWNDPGALVLQQSSSISASLGKKFTGFLHF